MTRDVLTSEQEDEILEAFEQRHRRLKELGDKQLAARYQVSERALYHAAERARKRREKREKVAPIPQVQKV